MSTVNPLGSNLPHSVLGAHLYGLEPCGRTVQFYAEDQSPITGLSRLIASALGTTTGVVDCWILKDQWPQFLLNTIRTLLESTS